MKKAFSFLFYCVQVYLVVVAIMVVGQRSFMYHPSQEAASNPVDYQAEVISYRTADDLKLTSWYRSARDNKPVVVMFHGNAGNISHRIRKLDYFADKGYGFFLAEYRGYGGNEGNPSEDGFYNDARAALNWLIQKRGVDENRVVLYGESIGSGVAMQMALEYKQVKAVVLQAPFTSARDMAAESYPFIKPFAFLTLDAYDNLSKAAHVTMPVLVLHGDTDGVVPVEQGRKLYSALASPKKELKILNGGGHSNLMPLGSLEAIEGFVKALDQ